MGVDMGWAEKMELKSGNSTASKDTIDTNESNYFLMQAKISIDEGRYSNALKYLAESLRFDPLNIDTYYSRAAVYAVKKDTQKMCADLLQLKNLQQVKATNLWNKLCQPKQETAK
jgi:tetratricopeptide (TPR) repeat protein